MSGTQAGPTAVLSKAGVPLETKPAASSSQVPLISPSVIDAPTQRLYAVSFFILSQAYKLFLVLPALTLGQEALQDGALSMLGSASQPMLFLPQAALIDFTAMLIIFKMRIPRLSPPKARWLVIFILLEFCNYTIVTKAAWVGVLLRSLFRLLALLIPGLGGQISKQLGISENWVRVPDLISPQSRILGQHTIHMLPRSAAEIVLPATRPSCKCIGPLSPQVTIPVVFNNTRPRWLQYSISPFGGVGDIQMHNVTISDKDLRKANHAQEHPLTPEEEEELDLEELSEITGKSWSPQSAGDDFIWRRRQAESRGRKVLGRRAQATAQYVYDLAIKDVGRLTLERVLDGAQRDVFIRNDDEIVFVECPAVSLTSRGQDKQEELLFHPRGWRKLLSPLPTLDVCPATEVELSLVVQGIAPLEVTFTEIRTVNGRQDAQQRTISHVRPLGDEEQTTRSWAHVRQMVLPLTVQTKHAGVYELQVDRVKDGFGNVVQVDALASAVQLHSRQSITVHGRPRAQLRGCERPFVILEGKPPKQLGVAIDLDEPFSAAVYFEPESFSTGQVSTSDVTGAGSRQPAIFHATEPGTYSIKSVNTTFCDGSVVSPWTCTVTKVPKPKASITLDTIDDQCAGAVGVKAHADLVGTPPFKLEYEVQLNGHSVRRMWTTDRSRAELEFPLEKEGRVEYGFLSLADAHYRDPIPLDGPRIQRIIHPLASASFVGRRGTVEPVVVRSCSGDVVQAEIILQGVEPFELFYEARTAYGLSTHSASALASGRHTLDIPLGDDLSKKGGAMVVTLTKIRDSRGCEKDLSTKDLRVEVKRHKPTAAFTAIQASERQTKLLEGSEARLPITLTGEGPWEVVYTMNGQRVETTVAKADAELTVDRPGQYRLLSIHDSSCPGDVVESRAVWDVSWIEKPTVRFASDEGSVQRNGSLLRAAICRGVPDHVAIQAQGHFPVSLIYEGRLPETPGHRPILRDSLTVPQESAYVPLHTDEPGWHRYSLIGVGDALYSNQAGKYGTLEQMVFDNPSATFTSTSASTFCLHDTLTSSDKPPSLQLRGRPPFTVKVDVQSPSATIQSFLIDGIPQASATLDLARFGFEFNQTGRWSAAIRSVLDGNGCWTDYDTHSGEGDGRITFDVLETAGIASVGVRDDFCVGEAIEFTLQGSPPWTVVYGFNGRNSSAKVRESLFSRIAEKPGVLEIKSVAHGGTRCRLEIPNPGAMGLVKSLHDLPSVRVDEGKNFVQDIVEGTQAEIKFHFSGKPPFSFTYHRTEPADAVTNPRVLDTQTVTGILDHEYSIYTSEEGTWGVTWLQDRHCAVSIDGSTRKSLGKSKLAISAP
ncbi:hypothetical protein K437DRAFT_223794 [Tilletiaria anomala UBC 951]|uniref:Nucleoporin Pom152 n=1 Tax=Tilletiaria anomala (strain ATCC 24038 / CBS 436.72 / UBC 951) TaxID=1037660 RepID=A0A066W0P7_TILAU|nr:uncharacterized protein K437DRAFT_223794 [Tilletiaria anomala UBC 951]KDN46128.1 hypothetical protein K437DRAFT_223794 [Tilletiaria anomala UBC 951]